MALPVFPDKYQLFIGGKWQDASDGATYTVTSPCNGQKLSECAEATRDDVDAAVKAAHEAFKTWKKTAPAERYAILNKMADVIDANRELLATIETLDNGKPIRETKGGDMLSAASQLRYFAAAIYTDEGAANMLNEMTLNLILHEPIGVVGQIVPWNFPLAMATWKIAAALSAGCCTVFKPSSHTSLSVLTFAKLVENIVPPGVLNIITGSGSRAGQYMLDHEGFQKLALTGSTEVGLSVARAAAEKLIPATLELGGKSANIFFDDCNWDLAIDGIQRGILSNQGEVCGAGSRIFVQEGIYDRFVEEAVKAFKKVKVGDPLDMSTQMGALTYEKHLQEVLEYVRIGVEEGATIATGGHRIAVGELAKGCFMEPTLLVNVKNSMRVAQEEIFGPVGVVIKFKDEADVIAMANDSVYGLAGGVYTQDINRAINVCRAIETGRMWVNWYGPCPVGAPFGGYKKSGYGRESHKMLMEHYMQTKSIMISLNKNVSGLYS